jgi:formylglycine-generating enzyme required for sulfatase activity
MKRRVLLFACFMAGICAACSQPAAEERAQAAVKAPQCGLADADTGKFVSIPEGGFEMGANALYPEERPERLVHVGAFQMQINEVTNAEFMRFVDATGYVTDAERSSASPDLGGGSAVFALSDEKSRGGSWKLVRHATWKTPGGRGTNIVGRLQEPVVHVSLNDAHAYAQWAGGRLPSEEEWEYAAMTGMADPDNRDSGAFDEQGKPIANTWQGLFPVENDAADGFAGAAPVGCFAPNRLGLYDMIGNVWEWTDTPYAEGMNTIKGGSYLCAENYCHRYRGAARQGQEVGFSSNHIGFRIVKDVPAN